MNEEITIEETFDQLEEVLKQMEAKEISLEESFACYERGMKLVKACNDKLDKVEKQIIVLSEEQGDEGI
ncbi:MAG: exodeoxyribonuclease VII small subunit [Lachnospiraceae bacterium]|jgi:exodeoxyribonuclease VII small subunit|nr:exodeoxyribonuclease VII small subunit [Lachnospiraceae bacterium]MCI9591846.1 exodeoxyribonuclease VII small subunit [Lachnospiraceae bacterium]